MTGAELRIGVVLEAFLDWPLDEVLPWLRRAAPEVTDIEVGAGGYAPHPHCDVSALLANTAERSAWLDRLARHGIRLDALNAWGNPLHPDQELARRHDEDLRNAIRLAALLGADRVVAMAGLPAGAPGDGVPHFGACGWLPYLEGIYERAVDRAHRAVLDRARRLRRGRSARRAGLPRTAPGHLRVQRGDVPPGRRSRAVDRRQP